MGVVAVIVGVLLVLAVLADVVNTLIMNTRSTGRFWLTVVLYTWSWRFLRTLGQRLPERRRVQLYALFAPISVILLLMAWVLQQIVGFGLIWWGLGGINGAESLGDSMYYSGVVYFTLGFGEIVPVDVVPRLGALIEAFSGVLTTALVIGYLPALYSAYSEREQKLLTLDDGSEGRITPTNLVISHAPDANPRDLDSFFQDWERWVAQVMETHTTFRMLVLFRSQHPGQHWVTALGVVTDAALHMEMMEGSRGRAGYWMLRRSTRLLQMLTEHVDLSEYRARSNQTDDGELFANLYETLQGHGFPMVPFEEAREHARVLREGYDARLEYLIDMLDAPRGFWGHSIGHQRQPESLPLPD